MTVSHLNSLATLLNYFISHLQSRNKNNLRINTGFLSLRPSRNCRPSTNLFQRHLPVLATNQFYSYVRDSGTGVVPGQHTCILLRKGFRDTNNLIIYIFLKQKRNLKKYCVLLNTDTWTTFWWFQIVDSYSYRWVSIIQNDPLMRGVPGQCKVFRDTGYLINAVCGLKPWNFSN